MKDDLFKKRISLCCLIYLFHFCMTQFILPWRHEKNIFPFYDWDLFSFNATYQTWPFIRILEVNHVPVAPPRLVYHNGISKRAKYQWRGPEQMARFVKAVEANGPDHEFTQLVKREMEQNLFHDKDQVKYEAFTGRFNIRENLFQEGQIEEGPKWTFEYSSFGGKR